MHCSLRQPAHVCSADPSRAEFEGADRDDYDDVDGNDELVRARSIVGLTVVQWTGDSTQEVAEEQARLPTFPELEATINKHIASLGGAVLPKLNWSAPRVWCSLGLLADLLQDACWIAPTNSMRCTSAGDVFLLIKSSDFVTHDLTAAFDGCDDVESGAPSPSFKFQVMPVPGVV